MNLLRCPFCGGKAHTLSQYAANPSHVNVVCENCGANTGIRGNKENAENAWNRRAIFSESHKRPEYIQNPDDIKIYEDMKFIYIIIHLDIQNDRLVKPESLKWRCDTFTDENSGYAEEFRYITLADISEQILKTGYNSTILVVTEDPLDGNIYRYGNCGEFWERVGRMCGYA